MNHKIKTLKASELIEDFSIYPRNCIFDGHIYDLLELYNGGAVFPPIVADAKSKRITDGFHRRRMFVRAHGQDAEIEVMLVEYPNEQEMLKDAVIRNRIALRRLTSADIAHCARLAKDLKISREELSGLLQITRERLAEIIGTRSATGKSGPVIVRRAMVHLAGKKLTTKQEEVHEHVGGQTAIVYANWLINLIESKSLPDDDKLIERLRILHGLLEAMLVA